MDPDACAKFFRREHFDWADEVAAGESDGEDSVIVVTENVRLSPSAQYASSLIEAFRQLQVANTLHKEAEAVRLSSHRPFFLDHFADSFSSHHPFVTFLSLHFLVWILTHAFTRRPSRPWVRSMVKRLLPSASLTMRLLGARPRRHVRPLLWLNPSFLSSWMEVCNSLLILLFCPC